MKYQEENELKHLGLGDFSMKDIIDQNESIQSYDYNDSEMYVSWIIYFRENEVVSSV